MGQKIAPAIPEAYSTHWERRDVLGVHKQKQEGLSWIGLCIPAGRLSASDFFDIGELPFLSGQPAFDPR